jgi:Lrp/AsnC family transcriptional regulator, leucine-responsive regulatory protein
LSSKRRNSTPSAFRTASRLLDSVNIQILKELQLDPRVPTAKLARVLRMSPPAVTERIQRLWEAGVIAGYRLDLDPGALGLPVTAYVRIRPSPGQLSKVAELAQRTAEVVECHRITGEDCFLIKVHVAEITSIEKILDRFLAYGQTTTSIVQSSPVPLRAPPLPRAS